MCMMRLVGLFLGLLLMTTGIVTPAVSPPAVDVPCPTDTIRFSQAEGCLNDGSIEFCIPAGDPVALAAVQQIAPKIECHPWGGRARCDTSHEILCMVPTGGLCRADDPHAMTDTGWALVCELAAQPFVDEIVATWYE